MPALSFAPALLLQAQGPALGLKAAIFDVDGVLTDGRIYVGEHGETVKAFSTLDGHGLKLLREGGIEPLACTAEEFSAAITRENHTLKRALTDPHILSGIGNAYSDEILHRARLSPVRQTRALSDGEHTRLYDATRATLHDWIVRLRQAAGGERSDQRV